MKFLFVLGIVFNLFGAIHTDFVPLSLLSCFCAGICVNALIRQHVENDEQRV
jgi:hypothetical protein